MRKFILHVRKRRRAKAFREKHQQHTRPINRVHGRHRVVERRQRQNGGEDSAIRKWIAKDGWALAGIVIMLSVGFWYFGFHTEKFIIRQINIEGTEFINQDQLKVSVDEFVLSKAFGLIRRNTFWTMKPSKLKKDLEKEYGEQYALDFVEVTKQYPDTINVVVHEQIPSIAWQTVAAGADNYYLVSREGVVTQALTGQDDVHPSFPLIQDHNRDFFEPGWHIASENYVGFILYLQEEFTKQTGLEVEHYIFPTTECQERSFVAEKVFEQEILNEASEEFQNEKRDIQQLFLDGLLTIDQSLSELERIKREELERLGEIEEGEEGIEKLEFETVYLPSTCDYVKVATNVSVVVKNGDEGSYLVTMDMSVDPVVQMKNALTVLQEKIQDRASLRYIDVRIPDRAYYR